MKKEQKLISISDCEECDELDLLQRDNIKPLIEEGFVVKQITAATYVHLIRWNDMDDYSAVCFVLLEREVED